MSEEMIDIDQLKFMGSGISSDVYEYKEGKILKLFQDYYTEKDILFEMKNAQFMEKCGLAVPKCYGIVECQNRKGLIYEQIQGENLIKAFSLGGNYREYIYQFALLHKQVLSHQANELMSYKELLFLYASDNFKLKRKIVKLPEGNVLCHGDFQPGNVMIQKDGSLALIDFMEVCKGVREYDIARSYYYIKAVNMSSAKITLSEKERAAIAKSYLDAMEVEEKELLPFIEVMEMLKMYHT